MRALIALFVFALAGCGGVSAPTGQALPACTAARVANLDPCDWRALNAGRRSDSLVGYYVSAGSDVVGELIIVEGDDNSLVVSIDGYSPRTTHLCAGAFEGVAGEATLTPLAGETSEGSTCRASLRRTGRDEVFFGLTDYPCICGARAYVDGDYRLRRRD